MSLRPTPRRTAVRPLLAIVFLGALTLAGCGDSSSPAGPSQTAPILTSVTPNTGTSFGGTQVTITGDRFAAGATVSFGGVPGTNIAVENSTTIRATTPAHGSGVVDIQVSGSTGTGTLGQAFTFVAPSGTNNPPVIKSLTAKGRKTNEPANFADVGETIDLTAVVEDVETPIDKLTFQWVADIGSVSGTGPVVTWTAPASASTPRDVTITVTVIESYKAPDANGLPVDKQNTVTQASKVSLHNSLKELADMAYDFLVLFSNSAITDADVVLRDFNTTCPGYTAERADVVANRQDWLITDYSVATPVVTINFSGACTLFSDRYRAGDGCANVGVQWTSKNKLTGVTGTTKGTDQVTGRYDNGRWWLCDSDYLPLSSSMRFDRFGMR